MKNFLFFIFLIKISISFAQKNNNYIYKGQSAIYYELFGTSGTPNSIHYDRVLSVLPSGYYNASIGFGTFFKNDLKYFTIPTSINYTNGVNKNHFVIGIPIIYRNTETDYYKMEHIFFGVKLAYKYQAKNKFFFKVSSNLLKYYEIIDTSDKEYGLFGRVIDLDRIKYLLGLSFGYSF